MAVAAAVGRIVVVASGRRFRDLAALDVGFVAVAGDLRRSRSSAQGLLGARRWGWGSRSARCGMARIGRSVGRGCVGLVNPGGKFGVVVGGGVRDREVAAEVVGRGLTDAVDRVVGVVVVAGSRRCCPEVGHRRTSVELGKGQVVGRCCNLTWE